MKTGRESRKDKGNREEHSRRDKQATPNGNRTVDM